MKKFAVITVLSLVFYSCERNENIPSNKNVNSTNGARIDNEVIFKNKMADKIAKTISSNLTNKEFKLYILNNAQRKFDGDANFLFLSAINNENSDSKVFKEHFKEFKKDEINYEEIEDNFPLMQIYLFNGTEKSEGFDINSKDILVGYKPSNLDFKSILAYDQKGEIYKLDKDVTPNRPVIIISENERLIEIGEESKTLFNLQPILKTKKSSFYLKKDYFEYKNKMIMQEISKNTKAAISSSKNSKVLVCTRDNNTNKDRFNDYKFNNSAAYNGAKDGWFDGTLEFQSTILLGGTGNSAFVLQKYFNSWEGNLSDLQWRSCFSVEVFNWDKTLYGDAYMASWLEDDGGGTKAVTNSFSNVKNGVTNSYSATYNIPKNNYDLGSSLVQYCDDSDGVGYTYSTGKISFRMNTPN